MVKLGICKDFFKKFNRLDKCKNKSGRFASVMFVN